MDRFIDGKEIEEVLETAFSYRGHRISGLSNSVRRGGLLHQDKEQWSKGSFREGESVLLSLRCLADVIKLF